MSPETKGKLATTHNRHLYAHAVVTSQFFFSLTARAKLTTLKRRCQKLQYLNCCRYPAVFVFCRHTLRSLDFSGHAKLKLLVRFKFNSWMLQLSHILKGHQHKMQDIYYSQFSHIIVVAIIVCVVVVYHRFSTPYTHFLFTFLYFISYFMTASNK